MTEEWRSILDGQYAVSSLGAVRNSEGHIMAAHPTHGGYLAFSAYVYGQNRLTLKVHRMVAWAFLGPPSKGLEVNHKDGNLSNNAVSNLEYVTHTENVRHAIGMRTKLTPNDIIEIRRRWNGGDGWKSIGVDFGLKKQTVLNIAQGRSWRNVT